VGHIFISNLLPKYYQERGELDMSNIKKLAELQKNAQKRLKEAAPAEAVAEKILEFLGTRKSCKLEEIAKAVGLPEDEVERILNFLACANLVGKSFHITRFGLEHT
jgi:DNA polymerase/3'-5' exonuclease PolX